MVCCLFLPVSRQKRPEKPQAVLITDVMVNVKNISLDKKKLFKKIIHDKL